MKLRMIVVPAAFAVCTPCFSYALAATAQKTKPEKSLSISFSGKPWSLIVDYPGFVVETKERKADGRQYLLATNHEIDVTISITLEQAPDADPRGCPPYLHQRADSLAPFDPSEIKFSQIGKLSVLEYFIAKENGIPIRQQSVVACSAKDGVYADIHLSKTSFQLSEQHFFTDILNATHFSDEAPGESGSEGARPNPGSSYDLFLKGSRYFVDQNFSASIPPYQAAFDLEEKKTELSKTNWRVLVDNLAMAYGITGDLAGSERIYNLGITKDPEFPNFYYGLACVYAGRDNMDKTKEYLRKAFQYRANVIAGESMPDPAKDDSFEKYMTNPEFQEFVKSLNASH
jgi:tetratricopeptide (TPR) repeat protein